MMLETALSYDDISIRPTKSPVESRSQVNLESCLIGDITVENPVISAPMDSVTESEMAQAMADSGGVGIIHRYLSIEEQAEEVSNVDGIVGATIGINSSWEKRLEMQLDAGADFICVDVAHGHLEKTLEVVKDAKSVIDVPLMAGNVSTGQGAVDLAKSGVDSVKVGVGPGSHCLTREVTGVGVPQVTALNEVRQDLDYQIMMGNIDENVTVVADGGIQKSGDMAKALLLGADTVMIGGLLAGCEESAANVVETNSGVKYKKTHGMASEEAREDNGIVTDEAVEGASGYTPYSGPVENTMEQLSSGVRSTLSYVGAFELDTARENAEFVRITPNVSERNGTHGVYQNR